MYNRYIPQPDGTYRRNRMQDPVREVTKPAQPIENSPSTPCPDGSDMQPCQGCVYNQPPRRATPTYTKKNIPPVGIGSFFRSLLPKDFDTEDLLIILLLLLMAGDDQEDQNSALLTLALYLFM